MTVILINYHCLFLSPLIEPTITVYMGDMPADILGVRKVVELSSQTITHDTCLLKVTMGNHQLPEWGQDFFWLVARM